jgi:carbon-monoxide dehydrogenase large subunit
VAQYGIGQSVSRDEDPQLLRSDGRFVADVDMAGQCHGVVVRSPHAAARIRSVDGAAARTAPGVRLVLTGEDVLSAGLGTVLPEVPRQRRDGSAAIVTPQPLLMTDRARYVGDCVAFVVADTLAEAQDGAELVAVDYEPLEPVISSERAVAPGAPLVWQECAGNEAFFHQAGDRDAVDAIIETAPHVIRHKFVINRITTNPMEPRAAVAEYDRRTGRYTIWCTVQTPHPTRLILAEQIFHIPETSIRVVCEQMGGGFGMKGGCYSEYALCMWAARRIGRAVKWVAERSESLLSDDHTRDNVTEAALALDTDGNMLALRVKTLADIGAYYTSDRSWISPIVNLGVLAGTYVTPAIHVEVTGVLTNTRMTGPYRGAGRPEAAYVIESMISLAARELGIDPVELRRRNTIPADAMPFNSPLTKSALDAGGLV